MYTKTFEVLSKYISGELGVTVNFDNPHGAKANVKTNVISMPKNISGDNALGALALLMHEAAHLKYTKELPQKKLIATQTEKHILNVLEDVRIDRKNFGLLPNVREFYRQLYKKCPKVEDVKEGTPEAKALICAIDACEGFRTSFPPEIEKVLYEQKLQETCESGINHLEYGQWEDAHEDIQKIKKILKIDDSKEEPLQWETVVVPGGNGKDTIEIPVEGESKDGSVLKEAGNRRGGIKWGDGTGMKGPRSDATSEIAMEEQTIQNFKELLSIKEKKIVDEGRILDTDNLIALYTGDITELFKDEAIIKSKKSKIHFLMDCSGSMGSGVIDPGGTGYKDRIDVVKGCVQKVMDIIEEVRSSESLEVDYSIAMFDGGYTSLKKENWKSEYGAIGGTDFVQGMRKAIDELMSDFTVEGKRIIVGFTDGDVGNNQIEEVITLIQQAGSEIRFLLIAVGAQLGGAMSKSLVGDRIIMGPQDANIVLLETLKDLIE